MRKLNLTVTKIIVSNYQVPSLVEAYVWGGFTPSKTEQPLQGMELQEKATQKD